LDYAFSLNVEIPTQKWGRRGRDRMVVWFKTTYAIGAYHHLDQGEVYITMW